VGLIGAIIAIGLTTPVASIANLTSSTAAAGGIAGFFAALVAALWAYDGWNNVAMVSSEIQNPERNLPRALILGTLAVVMIYLLANAAYFFVLSAQEVGSTDRVAAEMMRRIMGDSGAGAVSLAAMLSIFAALNGSILTGSRVPYAMARDGMFFSSISVVHPRWCTPSNSILAMCGWSALLVLSGRYEQLFTYVIFSTWILYGMATASVIVLRRKRPDLPRPYRTLGYPFIPVLFVLVAVALLASTLRSSPRESLMGIGIIVAGLPFYFHWKRKLAR
jgi:basic amino acid/polyamine antiporter, APA family